MNFNISYQYNCLDSGGSLINPYMNSLYNLILMVIIIILLIIIIKVMHEQVVLGLVIVFILVLVTGAFTPMIIDAIDNVDGCISHTDNISITNKQNIWITLTGHPIKVGSQTMSNSTYVAVNITDYIMDYPNGRIKPLSGGGLYFGN